MTQPTVSVLMAAWDADRFIGEAIDSVLGQTRPPHEVIVVDDGSSDGTAGVIARYGPPVVAVTADHEGIGSARNRAMTHATGDVWAWLDADDRWRPEKLARQLAVLEHRPDLEAVFTLVDEFLHAGALPGRRAPGAGRSGPLVSSLLIRADAARRVGPFDPTLSSGDWIDWWSRAIDAGVVHGEVPEVLVERRIHDRNHSAQTDRNAEQYLRVLRARLQRGRAGS